MTAIKHASSFAQTTFDTSTGPAPVSISDDRDASRFLSLVQQHLGKSSPENAPVARRDGKTGLSDKIIGRATQLAGEIKKDHVHVTKMLETAAATGDQMNLMKAMLALNDYQMRIQFVSKTISKASSSVDQLTRMQ